MKNILLAFVISFMFTRCIILPVPHMRTHAPEVSGMVVYEKTLDPVCGAIVHDVKFGVQTSTNHDGRFVLPPVKCWHGAYFVSTISMSLFPSFDKTSKTRKIRIWHGPGSVVDAFAKANESIVVTIPID